MDGMEREICTFFSITTMTQILTLFIYLFFHLSFHPYCSFPSLFSLDSLPVPPFCLIPSTPLLFLLRKGQTSHECQQSMTYQVVEGLSFYLCVKARWDNIVRGIGSQTPIHTLGSGPDPTARSPTKRRCYTAVTDMQRAYVSPKQASLLLLQSLWAPMSPDQLLLWDPLCWPWPLWFMTPKDLY